VSELDYSGGLGGAASPDAPQFDVGSFLTGVTQDIAGFEKGLTTATEGKANKDLYQKYLDYFPQYEATKEQEYQTKEAQTLGDRLAAMGMRGIQTGGTDQPTSGAAAYTAQKSLYDAGYETLVNQLDLEKTSAEGKLNVANAQIQAGDVTMGASVGAAAGAAIGSIIPGIGTVIGGAIGAGVGALAGWIASWF
jgi:hypothetical protein